MQHYWHFIKSLLIRSSVVPFHSGIVYGINECLYIRLLASICRIWSFDTVLAPGPCARCYEMVLCWNCSPATDYPWYHSQSLVKSSLLDRLLTKLLEHPGNAGLSPIVTTCRQNQIWYPFAGLSPRHLCLLTCAAPMLHLRILKPQGVIWLLLSWSKRVASALEGIPVGSVGGIPASVMHWSSSC